MNKRKICLFLVLLMVGLTALPWAVEQARAQAPLTPGVNYGVANFAYSPTTIRKFIDLLPGINAANGLGQQIQLATPTTPPAGVPTDGDYYEIALVQYRKRMHSDLPPVVGVWPAAQTGGTLLRGYVQENNGVAIGTPNYLGPLIVATKNRPVRIKFTNRLPVGVSGNLFLPVDTTVMGAGMAADGTSYTQNRATLHLHGGLPAWTSDGTAHQWITPAGETTNYPLGASMQNVPDMPIPANGSMTFHWPNQQGGRLMFYHDHAYGITGLNVYAGEAAGYLLADPTAETALAGLGVPGTVVTNPATGGIVSADLAHLIPLVIQDKTFVPSTVLTTDPLWTWGGTGDLWFPHVYMPNQDPGSLTGANPLGRWDYGPWFWPVFPVTQPYPPIVSHVPEFFADTMLVNGTAYPKVNVTAQPYRLQILNACNDRMVNLQFYQADPAFLPPNAAACPTCAPGTEVKMVPAVPGAAAFPATWQAGTPGMIPDILDSRPGGVPDPTLRGPGFIQIASEGGLLPQPVVLNNIPVGYEQNKRNIVVLNVLEKTLFMAPAERADVIVDFTPYAGKTIILYNDSPAPVPAGDPRNDHYTGNLDYSATAGVNNQGGAPSTLAGYGPNTRTIMQFVVAGTDAAPATPGPVDYVNPTILTALQNTSTGLPNIFSVAQDPPIVQQSAYSVANGGPYAPLYKDVFSRISNNTLVTAAAGLASITVTAGGSGYTSAPTATLVGGDGTTVATLGAVTISAGAVTAVAVATPGAGYTVAPTVFFSGGGGTGATATAVLTGEQTLQSKAIQELFDVDYGRMNATLGVELPFTRSPIQTTIPLGFTDPATETFSAPNEVQLWKITHNGVDSHGIHFHLVNVQVVNRVGWDGAVRPPDPNELGWKDTVRMHPLEDIVVAMKAKVPSLPYNVPNSSRLLDVTRPLGATGNFFTNIDPLTGAGVTTVNNTTNFGWEYTWHCHILGHEEFDMMRPIVLNVASTLPPAFSMVSGVRGTGGAIVNLVWTDPTPYNYTTGLPLTTLNNPANEIGFLIQRGSGSPVVWSNIGTAPANASTYTDSTAQAALSYQYRVVAFNAAGNRTSANTISIAGAAPTAPTGLTATLQAGPRIGLSWTDNATNETGFVVERSTNGGAFVQIAAPAAHTTPTATGTTTYVDPPSPGTLSPGTYTYRVKAMNGTVSSAYTNQATVTVAAPLAVPGNFRGTALRAGATDTINFTWTYTNGTQTGFQIQRATNSAFSTNVTLLPAITNPAARTASQTGLARGVTYYYRIQATGAAGATSAWSAGVRITTP